MCVGHWSYYYLGLSFRPSVSVYIIPLWWMYLCTVCLFVCDFISYSFPLYACIDGCNVCLSVCLSLYLNLFYWISMSVCLYVWMSTCQCLHILVCRSVCRPVSLLLSSILPWRSMGGYPTTNSFYIHTREVQTTQYCDVVHWCDAIWYCEVNDTWGKEFS